VKENYEAWLTTMEQNGTKVEDKYYLESFNDNRNKIFDYEAVSVPRVNASISEVLPPQFKHCKDIIVGAGVAWPTTLLWLLLSRIIDRIIEKITSLFKGVFNFVSRLAFGKL
jgi:hypothetical protein